MLYWRVSRRLSVSIHALTVLYILYIYLRTFARSKEKTMGFVSRGCIAYRTNHNTKNTYNKIASYVGGIVYGSSWAYHTRAFITRPGTLRNYDGDGNGNVKKAISLMSKTTTLQLHHAFLYNSLQSLHNYDVKWPNFKFTWNPTQNGNIFQNKVCSVGKHSQ